MSSEPWTPETNRIQTDMLERDEQKTLIEAIHKTGALRFDRNTGTWLEQSGKYLATNHIYRAKPAPVTQDVVPWEVIDARIMAAIKAIKLHFDSQQRPQPAATGAVTEPLAVGDRYWAPCPFITKWAISSIWYGDESDTHRLATGQIYITEAAAVYRAKRMTGGV